MRMLIKILIVLVILAGAAAAAYKPTTEYLAKRNKILWRTATVEQGDIISVVNSTGTVKPKLRVVIGSFVSGPIKELFCDFNQEIKVGDLLATIDPALYQANVSRDQAALESRQADVIRVKAQLQQAINDEKRAIALRTEDETFIAQAEMDKFKFGRLSLDAQLVVATTSIAQAQATLDNSLANLGYTKILAPVNGRVLERKIDPGQTVVAQMTTPELFIVAPDMRTEMHIHAAVDEADIGLIKLAQEKQYPVTFTVDAYPEKLFDGTIREIRLNFATTQNVVTYPVVVSAANPDLDLLPGMTASLSFQIDQREEVVKIPNAALRFYPTAKQVRPADVPILEGHGQSNTATDEDEAQQSEKFLSAQERAKLRKDRNRRHVWVADGELLRAVEVTTGLSDSQFTEMVSGTLKKSDVLVTGVQATPVGPPR